MSNLKPSSAYEYGTLDYFHARIIELEKERNRYKDESKYYRVELAKSHEILGRILHQTSERWDSVRITEFYPTNNLYNKRSVTNPTGAKQENKDE